MSMSPFVAFSRDSRLIAAAAGDNSVKIWDVVSGRELQTLAGTQGSMTSAIAGIFFIAFTPNGNVVTISDAIRVWDTASGQELRSIAVDTLSIIGFNGRWRRCGDYSGWEPVGICSLRAEQKTRRSSFGISQPAAKLAL